jgi:hypothetical protein
VAETLHEVEEYTADMLFPVSKEELVNGLLAGEAPGRMIALVERLPLASYGDREHLRGDLEEVSRVHAREVAAAHSDDEYLAVVLRQVGDVQHVSKEAFNRVVAHVVHLARKQGKLDDDGAHRLQQHLEAAFADLRESMSAVYDNMAPEDPHDDLPERRSREG